MKRIPAPSVDLDYLRRCKESTPEQRMDWLAAAVEFARAPKKQLKESAR